MPSNSIDCLGVRVARITWEQFSRWFEAKQQEPPGEPPALLYIVNAHTLNLAWNQPSYRAVLNAGSLVLNDGVGLELAAKLAGERFLYNFCGTDLFPRIFQELARPEAPLRVCLYGAAPGRAEAAAANLHERYPNVRVVGVVDGFQQNNEAVIERINATAPDLLLVGKGNPLQELWLHEHASRLRVKVAAGIGALIDFLSGAVPRAPAWVRKAKLEWVYRLSIEPRRLFMRYVVGNPLFLARAVRYQAHHER